MNKFLKYVALIVIPSLSFSQEIDSSMLYKYFNVNKEEIMQELQDSWWRIDPSTFSNKGFMRAEKEGNEMMYREITPLGEITLQYNYVGKGATNYVQKLRNFLTSKNYKLKQNRRVLYSGQYFLYKGKDRLVEIVYYPKENSFNITLTNNYASRES